MGEREIMASWCRFLSSSIGRKVVMALTGLGLSLFLFMHMAGNLVVLVNVQKFNEYALGLQNLGPILWGAELGLLAILVFHIVSAVRLARQNMKARPEDYTLRVSSGRSRRSWNSGIMMISGTVVLLFIIYHLWHFKYGPIEMVSHGEGEMRNLGGLVRSEFMELDEVLIYTVGLICIFAHIRHGFRSLFDTLGVAKSKWDALIHRVSGVYVTLVFLGFVIIPWCIYLGAVK